MYKIKVSLCYYFTLKHLQCVRGIFCGLEHLHSVIFGNQHSKPEIAHRDLKTKNIMVKYPSMCLLYHRLYVVSLFHFA